MSPIRIERLRWWHIDAVLRIEAEQFGDQRWTDAMFWSELAAGHYYVAAVEEVAEFNHAAVIEEAPLVGYAGMAVAAPEAWINNIAVRGDHQRRGVGAALLRHLLGHAQAGGAGQVLLEVAADNEAAQRLYDRFGFEAVGVRRGYYQPGNIDALVMRAFLPPAEVASTAGGAKAAM
jgi:ribosomal-protein-alanine N-acetyltransferase